MLSSEIKIIDQINSFVENKKKLFSFEISPKLNEINYDIFKKHKPLFTSISWHLNPTDDTINVDDVPALQKAKLMSKNNLILLHFNCYLMNEDELKKIVNSGLKNLFALRGGEIMSCLFGGNF